MLATLTAALLLGAPPAPEPTASKDAPPAMLQLFADESWYKSQKGDEQDFVGLLSRAPAGPGGTVGTGRVNPYRLAITDDKGKQSEREVYAGAHPELLAPYVGRKIKLIGKAVDTNVEGKLHAEIWPAHVELMDATPAEAPVAPRNSSTSSPATRSTTPTPRSKKITSASYAKRKAKTPSATRCSSTPTISSISRTCTSSTRSIRSSIPTPGCASRSPARRYRGRGRGAPFSYILPRRLVVMGNTPTGDKGAHELKVLGVVNDWPFGGTAPAQFVARSPKELALARGVSP